MKGWCTMRGLGFWIAVCLVAGLAGCQTPEKRAAAEHTFTLWCANIDPADCGQCRKVQAKAYRIEYPYRSVFASILNFVEDNAGILSTLSGLSGASILAAVGIARGMMKRRGIAALAMSTGIEVLLPAHGTKERADAIAMLQKVYEYIRERYGIDISADVDKTKSLADTVRSGFKAWLAKKGA